MSQISFLEKIRGLTEERVAQAKTQRSLAELKEQVREYAKPTIDLLSVLRGVGGPAIIAEVKRKSPSQGEIASELRPTDVAASYERAGANAISVLTEPHHFGGSIQDLEDIRAQLPKMPLLRKDFVIDPYQIYEARAKGADAILLIQALLGSTRLREFYELGRELGLRPLVEVHDEGECEDVLELGAELIGVNNRNLKTLEVDLDTSRRLAQYRSDEILMISESGIQTTSEVQELYVLGYKGFLIGTGLMRNKSPEQALRELRAGLR